MRRWLLAGCAALVVAGVASPAAAVDARTQPGTLVLQTVPALKGVRFSADGSTVTTDAKGVARLPVRRFIGLEDRLKVPKTQISADTIVELDRIVGDPQRGVRGRPIPVGLRVTRLVRWGFIDLADRSVPAARITEMRIRSNIGEAVRVRGPDLTKPRWVLAGRTVHTQAGLLSKDLYWVVDSVVVEGAHVVNKAQQRFEPNKTRAWEIRLMFYRVTVQARDLVFGMPTGRVLQVRRPDGTVTQHRLDTRAQTHLDALPRGSYGLTVLGTPVKLARPVMISKDQAIELRVVTAADIAAVGAAGLVVALGLLLIGRPRLRSRVFRRRADGAPELSAEPANRAAARGGASGVLRRLAAVAATALLVTVTAVGPAVAGPQAASPGTPTPVLAYYYIWFTPTSWSRAKIDYPLAGRYSSDESEVMRKHIQQAKSVGIDGFLVSWKDTEQLTKRLKELVDIARSEDFRLGIVYQGLDFARQPLPLEIVQHDLNRFAETFAPDPVFRIFEKPVVVWTGTDRYSLQQIASVSEPLRNRLLVLASAKSTEDYVRVASAVDGNAYYWSSVRPEQRGYREKLAQMSDVVHANGGLWIAPSAPGFDARLVGGERVVPRDDGETFRQQLAAAQASSPDALGIISWNEFSENTHIEPSEKHGHTALRVLADVLGTRVVVHDDPDSSAGRAQGQTGAHTLGLLGGLTALAGLGYLLVRRRRSPPDAAAKIVERHGVTR